MPLHRLKFVSLVALCAAMPVIGTAHAAPREARAASPKIAITLKPEPETATGNDVRTVEVRLRFDGIATQAGTPLVYLAHVSDNVDTVATELTTIAASDAAGPLRLSWRDREISDGSAPSGKAGDTVREWVADRATRGAIRMVYSVPAEASAPPRGPAPPTAFRNDDGGVSAAGNMFLLLPPGDARYQASVDWDLRLMPKGARGMSSLGMGHATGTKPMSANELLRTYFMGGRIGGWPARPDKAGFFSAWHGTPPFDGTDIMQWTGKLYAGYMAFFGEKPDHPYGVFLRYNPVNAGGGTAFFHSFVSTYGRGSGNGTDVDASKSNIAHEMFHTFSPFIKVPEGKESSWFGEGLATLYQRRLPLRLGLMTPDYFLENLNYYAARYYSSVKATIPNAEIGKRFWQDTRVRTIAYDRGMLYFANVDDQVRKATSNRQSLDDLMLKMRAMEKSGAALTNADWEHVLQDALGPQAVDAFRAFLAGNLQVPASDAFGPCFSRTTAKARRYELGFEPDVLAEPTRIVRGLIPGSAAAAAGLRDGDEIVKPVPQDSIQGNQQEILTLDIRRDGRTFAISYLPRGEEVDIYQWRRLPDVPDARCAL
ncbi:MAG: peptidase M61 [Novosphingobium sp.]|nr:peptidase M61 [Novosphingobium sp.]